MLLKDDKEHPIPERWRPAFRRIADAFVVGDFELRHVPIDNVAPLDPDTARYIAENVEDYGERLSSLDDATWDRSVYVWQDGYWEMLIDLSTEVAPASDLSIHVRLYEENPELLRVASVHVA